MDTILTRKDLYNAWHNSGEIVRRGDVRDLIAVYRHQWQHLLRERINERFLEQNAEKLRIHEDTSINLLRWVVDEIAAIYSQPASRTIGGVSAGLEPYTNNGLIDHYLDNACKYTHLCRELAIRPLVDDGKIVLDLVTPDRFTVVPHPTNPIKFQAIIIQLEPNKFSVWTSDSHFIADNQMNPVASEDNPDHVNPYGVIPYVVSHARFPAMSFFNTFDSKGLFDATVDAGVQKSDHNHLRHLQSFRQLVISGVKDEQVGRLAADPSSAILLKNPGASASVLDMQSNLEQHLETMFQAQRPTLIMNGIWADAVRGRMDGGSGYALSLKMHKQQVMWQRLRTLWKFYERQILDVCRVVLMADAGIALPVGDLEIAYPEIGPNSDPKERGALAESYKRVGMSRANIWREVFGKTEEWIAQNEVELFEETKRDSPLDIPTLDTGEPGVDGDPATIEVLDEDEVAE